jgi:hypothetical protein
VNLIPLFQVGLAGDGNMLAFHKPDGKGYRFTCKRILRVLFTGWKPEDVEFEAQLVEYHEFAQGDPIRTGCYSGAYVLLIHSSFHGNQKFSG